MRRRLLLLTAACLTGWATTPSSTSSLVDAHVHVLSPDGARRMNELLGADGAVIGYSRDADRVIAMLDSAGIDRGVIVSEAYAFGSEELSAPDELLSVERENNWVALQSRDSNGRLIAFCSINPTRWYALRELRRCRNELDVTGVKLNLASSRADLRDPAALRALQHVFRAADESGLALLIHVRAREDDYGAHDVELLIDEVVPYAPHVPLQIAHLGGWGGNDRATREALNAFAEALDAGKLLRDRTFFDISAVVLDSTQTIAAAIEQIGARNVLFASDWPLISAAESRVLLEHALRSRPDLLQRVMQNQPPYLR